MGFSQVPCILVTDAGLVRLKALAKLQVLSISYLQVTDVRLLNLKGVIQIQELGPAKIKMTNRPVHLKEVTQLQCQCVSDATKVTDAGLVHLNALTQLQSLHLSGSQVTDASLEHLKALTNLQELHLQNTEVSDEGVKKLLQALPNCKIEH
jgi:Leucine-rich repeat (LRR) protein